MNNPEDTDKSREKEIKRRAGAGQANLPFTRPDEKIVELISTGDALHIVSNYAVFRVYTPDDIDPEIAGRNIPWVVTRVFPYGSKDGAVARSLIQAIKANGKLLVSEEKQQAVAKLALKVATALLESKSSYEETRKSIEDVVADIQKNYNALKAGPGTIVLPHLPNFDGLAKSYFGSAKRCINEIVMTLQEIFQIRKTDRGNYTKTVNYFEPNSEFEKQIKTALQRLDDAVKYILESRNAIEHPKNGYSFQSRDFFLDPSRTISRPSWKLTHPKYGEDTWFDFIENGKDILDKLTLLAEATTLLAITANADSPFEVKIKHLAENDRNQDAPCNFEFEIVFRAKR